MHGHLPGKEYAMKPILEKALMQVKPGDGVFLSFKELIELMESAHISNEEIYATVKSGRLFTSANLSSASKEEQEQWRDFVREYREEAREDGTWPDIMLGSSQLATLPLIAVTSIQLRVYEETAIDRSNFVRGSRGGREFTYLKFEIVIEHRDGKYEFKWTAASNLVKNPACPPEVKLRLLELQSYLDICNKTYDKKEMGESTEQDLFLADERLFLFCRTHCTRTEDEHRGLTGSDVDDIWMRFVVWAHPKKVREVKRQQRQNQATRKTP